MEVIQLVSLGLIATILLVVIREKNPEMAVMLSVVAGVIIFFLILSRIVPVLELLQELARRAGVDLVYVTVILKIIGIAYLAEFAAQICRDAGEGAVAKKIEIGGKIFILVLAVPIIKAILDLILGLMPA